MTTVHCASKEEQYDFSVSIYLRRQRGPALNNRIPRICGSRASVALEFKIDGFVSCALLERHMDNTYTGQCRVNVSAFDEGDDLSAYLLQKGWAVALPDAPFEYHTLEKIARSRSFGVWGMPVDNVIDRRR